MVRIAGVTGTGGRNVLHLHDSSPGGATLSVMVSPDDQAAALDSAADRGIPTEVIDPGRETEEFLDRLSAYEVDLVCLDDFDGALSAPLIDQLPPVIASHPSLLPMFPGDKPVGAALEAGVRITGCTVYAVTGDDDRPIITQEPVAVYEGDTVETVTDRIQNTLLVRAVPRVARWFATDAIAIDDETKRVSVSADTDEIFPARRYITGNRDRELRYGENPHQRAVLYATSNPEEASIVTADQLNPDAKDLSYNNYNDADGALRLIQEFDRPAAAVIKHTNPAGCAIGDSVSDAYDKALRTDPMSAFGGIVALNRECDVKTADQIIDSFKEVVVAPSYTDQALDVLREKSNLRVLALGDRPVRTEAIHEKPINGGRLIQDADMQQLTADDIETVTDHEPAPSELESLLFAWHVVKHVKSNAIVFATGTETVGIGAGQMSRVDAVRLAVMKAEEHAEGKNADGAVMASDAFFPFPDGIEVAAEAGVEAVIQPGGSVNDDDVIAAANDQGIAMVFTGHRCFRHD